IGEPVWQVPRFFWPRLHLRSRLIWHKMALVSPSLSLLRPLDHVRFWRIRHVKESFMFSIAFLRRFAAARLFVFTLCTLAFTHKPTVLNAFHGQDGDLPDSGLIHGSDGNLYGTTTVGGSGSANCGTVFKITESGRFTSIYSFRGGNDGCYPYAAPIRDAAGN